MSKHVNKKILAVVGDLFYTAKIKDAAKRAGLLVEFVKEEQDLLEKAKLKPVLIILDLNASTLQPMKLVGKLKGNADLKKISLIAFLTHVQGELKLEAHEAGCDMVLARSAFSQNLPQILKRYSGTR